MSVKEWDLAWLRTPLVVTTIKLFIDRNRIIYKKALAKRCDSHAHSCMAMLFAALLLDLYKSDGVKHRPLLAVLL